jgi:putative nucleotidyltransferase-like protein
MTTGSAPQSPQDGSLLLYFLGIRHNGQANRQLPEPTASEWAQVLRQAGENGVTPLLYHRLKTTRPAPQVPSGALDHLRDVAIRSAAQSLQFSRELAQLLEVFRRHGITAIVLKGGHLGQVIYESFALRTMGDLDIMVRRDELARAAGLLTDLGYAPQYFGVEEVDYAQHHHIRPMAKPEGIRVEIHWSIARPTALFDIDLEGIWTRARRTEIAGVESLVLSPEDLILHLCLHASFAHKFRLGLRACWDLLEVARHYKDTVDWDQVVRRAQQWRIGKYVYLTLRLVRDLLAADIPVAALAALEPPGFPSEAVAWARTCIFVPESDTSVSPSMARFWTSRALKAKFTELVNMLCPPRPVMARIYRTPSESTRLYLYYPVRWADLLLRYGQHAWGLWRGDQRRRNELRAVSERAALKEWLRWAP